MSHFEQTIQAVREDINKLEQQLVEKKKLVNMLCAQADIPPVYGDADLQADGESVVFQGDEYFKKALNSSIKDYMERRRKAGMGNPEAEDIYDGLIEGGYNEFPGDKESAVTGLKITLGKSSHTFVKLPNGGYGLVEWYGDKPAKTSRRRLSVKNSDGTTAANKRNTEPASGDSAENESGDDDLLENLMD